MSNFFSEFNEESPLWTVSSLTAYIRDLFEIDFRLQDVRIEGELSNFIRARSGHLYFTLKDDRAILKCVMWRSDAEKLNYLPEDGDAVVAEGRVSVYEAGGAYQLYVSRIRLAGKGSLAQAFEELKSRLFQEGLFDPAHKRPLPPFPQKLGIVTSLDAAALRDILNVLNRRWPMVSVLIAPSLVQGVGAPSQIIRALTWLDGRSDVDVIIVARGGGSMEDLWAFNDEELARTIFNAHHPIIVGVGHEVDFTIADFVADLRAPTPSAAAELAVPDHREVRASLQGMAAEIATLVANMLTEKKRGLEIHYSSLRHLSPRTLIDNNRQRVDWLGQRLEESIGSQLKQRKNALDVATAALRSVSPIATIARGFAVVSKADGKIVRSVKDINSNDPIIVRVEDGQFGAHVD